MCVKIILTIWIHNILFNDLKSGHFVLFSDDTSHTSITISPFGIRKGKCCPNSCSFGDTMLLD